MDSIKRVRKEDLERVFLCRELLGALSHIQTLKGEEDMLALISSLVRGILRRILRKFGVICSYGEGSQ